MVGGGLAGCEAALQLASRGVAVRLVEMRPAVMTPAHTSGDLAELVCSNSLKSDVMPSAQALLKAELRVMGSALLQVASLTRVPAGKALAVDRKAFACEVTRVLERHPLVRVERCEVTELDGHTPTILATGPLTSPTLAAWLAERVGHCFLFFTDAISPIVDATSIDFSALFPGDRHAPGGADHWNIPLDRATYEAFVGALREADRVTPRPWEEAPVFEGCMPIEELARRGEDALAYGPLRPVGLTRDPGVKAVVQLRRENLAGDCYNLVGCQTRLRIPDQERVFRMLPGMARARFLRYGQVHRNTYLHAPMVLRPDLSLRDMPSVRVAGQLCGTEGYVESMAMGLLASLFVLADLAGVSLPPPPSTTLVGALWTYVTSFQGQFQPMNAHLGLLPQPRLKGRLARREAVCRESLRSLNPWWERVQKALEDAGLGQGALPWAAGSGP